MKKFSLSRRYKGGEVFFVCQFGESRLKVIKCCRTITKKVEFLEARAYEFTGSADKGVLSSHLERLLKELDFKENHLIVSLPRNQVTRRYLKVPSKIPSEVEKIANLQASRFLPYQAEELVTAYQPILVDKEGYTHINLFIAHQDIIENYTRVFTKLNISSYSLFLSSVGLFNLCLATEPQINGAVIVVDLDAGQAEIAIIGKDNFFFSRSFKVMQDQGGWENLIVEEMDKTKNAYLKEPFYKKIDRIVLFGPEDNLRGLADALRKQADIPVTFSVYWQKLSLPQVFVEQLSGFKFSFASLIGLALKNIPGSQNILPAKAKLQVMARVKLKERIKLVGFVLCIMGIFTLGLLKNIHNKIQLLGYMKEEIRKIEDDARAVGELKRRIEFIEKSRRTGPSALDILYELHQVTPPGITLIKFNYEEGGQIILRGQASRMDDVFELVDRLGESEKFQGYELKVRYASNKKISERDLVEFEIGAKK